VHQLDIADGLKELLISAGFTVKSLLNTSASDFAKILGIDEYVGKLLSDAVNTMIYIYDDDDVLYHKVDLSGQKKIGERRMY
jgi:hypothetical protein